jgi:hypothetical protein
VRIYPLLRSSFGPKCRSVEHDDCEYSTELKASPPLHVWKHHVQSCDQPDDTRNYSLNSIVVSPFVCSAHRVQVRRCAYTQRLVRLGLGFDHMQGRLLDSTSVNEHGRLRLGARDGYNVHVGVHAWGGVTRWVTCGVGGLVVVCSLGEI